MVAPTRTRTAKDAKNTGLGKPVRGISVVGTNICYHALPRGARVSITIVLLHTDGRVWGRRLDGLMLSPLLEANALVRRRMTAGQPSSLGCCSGT